MWYEYTHIQEYYSALYKGNSAICYNMDEPGGHMLDKISQMKKADPTQSHLF